MVVKVRKRDGSEEDFDEEKLGNSIEAASKDAGISEEKMNEVLGEVTSEIKEIIGDREEISAKEIRDKILEKLDKAEPEISRTWREYERKNDKWS